MKNFCPFISGLTCNEVPETIIFTLSQPSLLGAFYLRLLWADVTESHAAHFTFFFSIRQPQTIHRRKKYIIYM